MKISDLLAVVACCILIEVSTARLRHYHRHIQKCSKCPPGWGVTKVCNMYNNTRCERCEFGKTYSPHHSYRSPCLTCSKCGIGLYEAHGCSTFRDTICDDCTRVIYKPSLNRHVDFKQKCSYLFLD